MTTQERRPPGRPRKYPVVVECKSETVVDKDKLQSVIAMIDEVAGLMNEDRYDRQRILAIAKSVLCDIIEKM